jgi:hypothetical protein
MDNLVFLLCGGTMDCHSGESLKYCLIEINDNHELYKSDFFCYKNKCIDESPLDDLKIKYSIFQSKLDSGIKYLIKENNNFGYLDKSGIHIYNDLFQYNIQNILKNFIMSKTLFYLN